MNCFEAADKVIKCIIESHRDGGPDYSSKRKEIADLFKKQLWNGNWDCQTDFEDENFRDLRLIQEDEFDQHFTEEEPEFSDQLGFAAGHYIFYA